MTQTVYQGVPGIRAAFSNWRTQAEDVEMAWAALCEVAEAHLTAARVRYC